MTLDITICTYGRDGIGRVAEMRLPRLEGVRYVVSWQTTGHEAPVPLPEALLRDDVNVFKINSAGLSANRNNAVAHCEADLVYIADDDLELYPEGIRAMAGVFEEYPELDFAAFRYDGSDAKPYPDRPFDMRHPVKGYFVSSVELCFRRKVFDCGLRFSELMGIGAPRLGAGEEANMVHKALHRGFIGRFYPITVARHDGLTTGLRRPDSRVLMAEGALHSYVNRLLGPAKLIAAAYRRGRSMRNMPVIYYHLMRGYFYGLLHFRRNGEERRKIGAVRTCKPLRRGLGRRLTAVRGKCRDDC